MQRSVRLGACLWLLVSSAEAQELGGLLFTIPRPNAALDQEFGWALGKSAEQLIVGSWSGLRIFDPQTGAETLSLPLPTVDGVIVASLPRSVAGVGDWIAAGHDGAILSNGARGAVYLFDGRTGEHHLTLKNPLPGAVDYFGFSVAEANGKLLVGNTGDSPSGGGSVYIFDPETGEQLGLWANPAPTPNGQFGSKAMEHGSGDVLVSAPLNTVDPGFGTGVIYRFDYQSSHVLQEYANPFPSTGGRFGWSFDVSESLMLVGTPGTTGGGAAYLYDLATGDRLLTLEAPEGGDGDFAGSFGESVAIAGDYLLVGEPYADPIMEAGYRVAGASYIFDRYSGALLQRTLDPTPSQNEWFAGFNQLAAFGDRFAVSCKDDGGSVRMFALPASALVGDVNRDGAVDLTDFGILKAHFGLAGNRADGDLDSSGRVDLTDFGILKDNFGRDLGDTPIEPVPEPSAAALSLVGALGLAAVAIGSPKRLAAR